jgi:hypothetical protein
MLQGNVSTGTFTFDNVSLRKVLSSSSPTTLWKDRSGKGNNATPSNFAYTTSSGSNGQGGVVTDAIDDAVSINDNSSISFNGDFTLEATVKGTRLGQSEALICKGISQGVNIGYGILLRSTTPYVRVWVFDTVLKSTSICNTDIRDGKKHIVHGVRNGNVLKLYIDGILVSNDTQPSIGNIQTTQPLSLFYNPNNGTPNSYFGGTTYSLRMYNRALTDAEVLRNYKASR